MTQPTLVTERLQLVPLSDAHLDLEIELDSDPVVMRYLTGKASSRADVERAHQRRLAAAREIPGLGFWVGFRNDPQADDTHADQLRDDQFVGWWILQPPHGPDQPKVPGEADLGYRLLRPHWRRGYATEGARELIRYGFEDLALNRIFAQTMASNTASRATMSACGLRFVRGFISTDPYDELVPGAELGEVEYEITRDSWHHRHPGDRADPR